MQGKKQSVMVVLGTVILLLFSLSLTAQAQDSATAQPPTGGQVETLANGTVRITASPAQSAAVMGYWTRERLAATAPLAMPMDSGNPRAPRARPPSVLVPDVVAGGAPAAGADAVARAAFAQDWAALEASVLEESAAESPAAADGTPGLYASYIVNKNTAIAQSSGHRPAGRLSFTTPNGTSYCSASVISGNNIIATAAHCVYNSTSNTWYNNWVYTPVYRNGAAPDGSFPYQTCWILSSWIALTGSYSINSWADDDLALCKMRTNAAGQSLSNTTGWYGRQSNANHVRHIHNLGYPFQDYNLSSLTDAGKYLRLCANETFYQANNVMGGGCNWGPGISGGPWIASYDPFDPVTSYVNVVNSGLFVGGQNLYGGRFNSNNIGVLCPAAGC